MVQGGGPPPALKDCSTEVCSCSARCVREAPGREGDALGAGLMSAAAAAAARRACRADPRRARGLLDEEETGWFDEFSPGLFSPLKSNPPRLLVGSEEACVRVRRR